MITAIATRGGIQERTLRREMAKATREATREVKVVSFNMALEQAKFLTTDAGRAYGLIPTQTVVQRPDGTRTLQSDNTTLTLEDGGIWYLIRIEDDRQINLLREIYPDFDAVTFPKGTTKVIG